MKSLLKKIYILAWIIILLGILFKFLHFQGGGALLISGSVLLLMHSFAYFMISDRQKEYSPLLNLSIVLLTCYIGARFQFWALARPVYYLACLAMLVWIIAVVRKKKRPGASAILLTGYFIFVTWFTNVPSHQLYYLVNLHPMLNSDLRETNYRAWDRYSWFLYLKQEYDAAFDANQKAQKAATKSLEMAPDSLAKEYKGILLQHEFQIVHKQWESYP
jgi:hypothetical protein